MFYINTTIKEILTAGRQLSLPPDEPEFITEVDVNTRVPMISWKHVVGLSFQLEAKTSDCKYFVNRKWMIEAEQVMSLPHDFALRYVTSKHEEPASKYCVGLPEELGRKTPDLIFEADDVLHILEFGTKKLTAPLNLTEYYKSKLAKYTPLIQAIELTGKTVRFDIIIVSRSAVVSSVNLPEHCCSCLCARYMAGFLTAESIKRSHPEFAEYFIKPEHQLTQPVKIKECLEELKEKEEGILQKYDKRVLVPEMTQFSEDKVINQALSKLEDRMITMPDEPPPFTNFIDEGGRIDNTDSISRVPLVIPYVNKSSSITGNMPDVATFPLALSEIWFQALQSYSLDPERYQAYIDPKMDDPVELAKKLQQTPKEYRKMQHVIKLKLSPGALNELAELGVLAKSKKYNADVITKREFTQQHISAETNTDDIEHFINNVIEKVDKPFDEHQSLSISLLKSAIHDSKWNPCDTFNNNVDNVYEALLFISDLMRELACTAAHTCRRKEFILKKIPYWDCFAVIRPTGTNGHVFFSLMVNERLSFSDGFVFPKSYVSQNYSFYHFKSAQLSLIESLLTLPEKYLACKYLCTGPSSQALYKNLMTGVLIALDNKSDAEEVYTKSRYIYMKGIELPPKCRNPWQAMEGMPSRPRSRLTLFLLKRAYTLCSRVLAMKCITSGSNLEEWEQIPNFVSDDSLNDWEDVLQVMYTGYFRNKNAYTSGNQSMALLEKIVGPEIELQSDEQYHEKVINGSSTEPKKMEWNSGMLYYCIQLWLKYCKKKGIKDVKKQVTEAFIRRLSTVRLTDIATLKASNVDEEEGDYVDGEKTKPRQKLLLNVMNHVDEFGDSLATALPKAIERISQRKGSMMISLFKKAQHGGLREIYVMDLSSRIIQYCLEVLGRVICETFDFEAMTHTHKKMTYRSEHVRHVEGVLKSIEKHEPELDVECFTTFDNADAEKWNQYHHVNKFAFMLVNMTEDILHPFIRIGLSQWLNKRIRMEDHLLHAMSMALYHPKSPTAKHIVDGFQGKINTVIVPKQCKDLHVESGMMQGLLHFVSSALHSLAVLGYHSIAERYIKRMASTLSRKTEQRVYAKAILTTIVTSDDSVSAISVISNMPYANMLMNGNLMCSALKEVVSSYFGIITSKKKSSLCTAPISEFNSQWIDRRQVIRPKMRHILACFTIESMGNFVEMQDNLCSLRQQALESGVSIHHVSFINFLQGLSFYRCAGSSTTPMFPLIQPKLEALQDPNMGFFLLDPPMLSGMTSIDFDVYDTMLSNPMLAARYAMATKNIDTLSGCSGSLRVATSMAIEFTNVHKYKAILKNLDSTGIRKYVEDNPDILYRKPRNLEEVKVCLGLKVMQPNVLRSISKDYNVLARELASCVYLFWAPIVRPNKDVMDLIVGREVDDKNKKSMAEMINLVFEEASQKVSSQEELLTEDMLKLFFPLHEEYDRLIKINEELENRIPISTEVMPKSACTVQVFEGIRGEISLPKLCAFRWFNLKDIYTSDAVMSVYWEDAKEDYAFLKDTHNETLDKSGLNSAAHLRMVLERVSKKGKFISPASRGGRGVHSAGLVTFASYNFKENVVMRVPTRQTSREDETTKRLKHISMILQIPFETHVKEKMILDEINRASFKVLKNNPRYAPLALVHKSCSKRLTYERVMAFCASTTATVGSWTVPQEKVPYMGKFRWKGAGEWRGSLFSQGRHTSIILEVYDCYLEKIWTTDLDELKRQQARFIRLVSSLKLRPVMEEDEEASAFYHDDFSRSAGTPVRVISEINPSEILMEEERPTLQVIDQLLMIKFKNTVVYHFPTRPDMIIGTEVVSRNPLVYVLNNWPMPTELAKAFLLRTPQNMVEFRLKDWFISLIQASNVGMENRMDINIGDVDPMDFFAEADLSDESDADERLVEVFKNIGDEEDEITTFDMSVVIPDRQEEEKRVFDTDVEASYKISRIHFKFLTNLINDFAPELRRLKQEKRAFDASTAELYKIFTNESIPVVSMLDIEDTEEEEELNLLEESFSESAKTRRSDPDVGSP